MTDYLEALLEEQEQEEFRPVPEWKRRLPFLPTTEKTVQGTALSGVELSQVQWDEAGSQKKVERSVRRNTDFIPNAVSATALDAVRRSPLFAEALTAEMVRLRRAVRQADSRNSHRAVSETDTAMASSGISWDGKNTPVSKAADYAALVDAAFARDARRYDGPLGLL